MPAWRSDKPMRAGHERWREQELHREDERQQIARAIWAQAVDTRGTAVEDYLRARGLELPSTTTERRFNPECVWHKDVDRPEYPPGRHATLLAAFRSLETDEIVAIHRIRLDVPQRWPKTVRKMLGPIRSAAVKLAEVGDTLAIAEGVETAMAGNQMAHGPAWALGSATVVSAFPVLTGIRRLILLVENNEASRVACKRCGERWLRAGRQVIHVVPEHGDDLNDELMFQKGLRNG
jgi:putative DNA primase/helicase